MMKSALILIATAAIAVTGCSAQPAAPALAAAHSGRQCFLARQVNGYTSVSDQIVDVKVAANRYFRLSLDGSCPQADFSRRVILRTTGGSDWICQGLDAEIIVPFAGGPQRCLVRDVQPISKAAWLADRRH
jgi:hypothetical protein